MMAATLKEIKNNEVNNWLRWVIGIGVTILIGLVVHIGNEGSVLKHEQGSMKAVQSEHGAKLEAIDKQADRMERKQDYIIEKIDKLYERK